MINSMFLDLKHTPLSYTLLHIHIHTHTHTRKRAQLRFSYNYKVKGKLNFLMKTYNRLRRTSRSIPEMRKGKNAILLRIFGKVVLLFGD